MTIEIARRLIGGTWRTGAASEGGAAAPATRLLWVNASAFAPGGTEKGYGLDLTVPCADAIAVEGAADTSPFFDVAPGAQFCTFINAQPLNGDDSDSFALAFNGYVWSLDGTEVLNWSTVNTITLSPAGPSNFVVLTLADVTTGFTRGSDIAVVNDNGGHLCFQSTAGGDFVVSLFVSATLTLA